MSRDVAVDNFNGLTPLELMGASALLLTGQAKRLYNMGR